MHSDTVGPHQSRHPDLAIRRVGRDTQGIRSGPALDEGIPLRTLERGRDESLNARASRTHSQRLQPRGKHLWVEILGAGQRGQRLARRNLGQFGRGIQTRRRLREERTPGLIQATNDRTQPTQRDIRPTGNNKARIGPQRHIRGRTISCIGGDQESTDLPGGIRSRQLEARLASGSQGRNRHLPGAGTIPLADVTHRGESPDRTLPRLHHGGHGSALTRLGLAPTSPDLVQERRGFGFVQCLPQEAEVLGIEPAMPSRGLEVLGAPRTTHGPQFQRCVQIPGQRQHTAVTRIEPDALKIDRGTAAILGVAPVELPDGREAFFGPVTLRSARREPHPVGKQDRMASDLFGRIEVFGDQRGRHHQRLPHVHEPLARGRIHREFTGRIERIHAGQIPDRVGVFGIGQTP